MSLTTGDILKLKKLLVSEIKEDIKRELEEIRGTMATKEQESQIQDILARQEKYINEEQSVMTNRLDNYEGGIEELEEKFAV